MTNLTSRVEFRAILKRVVSSLTESLAHPTVTPLTPEQIHFWLQEITLEDIRVVVSEMDAEGRKTPTENDGH